MPITCSKKKVIPAVTRIPDSFHRFIYKKTTLCSLARINSPFPPIVSHTHPFHNRVFRTQHLGVGDVGIGADEIEGFSRAILPARTGSMNPTAHAAPLAPVLSSSPLYKSQLYFNRCLSVWGTFFLIQSLPLSRVCNLFNILLRVSSSPWVLCRWKVLVARFLF